ncbi:hypothetical protein [Paenibacillus sp. WLX2291]|uniref:hypothetical protein n=1 Tax=Paenibacillus sp. WLX2291 TaxID=3296934 RepID=UPI00398408EF
MATDITELRKSNGELRATVRYFDQIQRASERLGRTQYQNIMKPNNELKFTVRYFESAYRTALKLSRLRLMPTISLNDQATPALQRLLRKLRSVQDEAINASGHYTVKQKLDVFIKGLKIPPPGPVNVTVDSNSNSNLLALLSSSKTEKAEEPESIVDTISKYIDLGKNIIEIPTSIDESVETIKKWLGKGKSDEGESNLDRAANSNKKCCCCCKDSDTSGSPLDDIDLGDPDRKNNDSDSSDNRNQNNGNNQNNNGNNNNNGGNNGGSGGNGGRKRGIKGFFQGIGGAAGKFFESAKRIAQRNPGERSGFLSTGLSKLKGFGSDIAAGAAKGWKKTKELFTGTPNSSGIISRGWDGLKNITKGAGSGLSKSWDAIKSVTKSAGSGLAKGAGKIFRPLGAVMDIASIATATSGKERGAAIGSMIAGALGTMAGGALGSVVPGAGTAIGGIGGGMLFGAAGDWLGGKIGGLFDTKKAAAAPAASIASPLGSAATGSAAATVTAKPATVTTSAANKPATGKDSAIQIDSNQMNAISSSLKDFKTEVTNAVSINIPAGAVQLTVKENELDYDALVLQIGQRVVNELRKSMQNRKSNSQGNTSAKPIMA